MTVAAAVRAARVLDLSHHQPDKGPLSWPAISGAVGGVIVKATQAASIVDPAHDANVAGARSCGLLVGHYHYAGGTDGRLGDPVSEALHFIEHADHRPGELLVLDYEPKQPPPPNVGDSWAAIFLGRVQSVTGVLPLLYLSESTARGGLWTSSLASGAELWAARYGVNNGQVPTVTLLLGPWAPRLALWQYTSAGTVAGVPGYVDLSVSYLSPGGWQARGGQLAAIPTPLGPRGGFDLSAWRAKQGDGGSIFYHLGTWANATFPGYASTPIAPLAERFGPQTRAFLAELAHRAARDPGCPGNRGDLAHADGANVGNDLAGALAHYGFGAYLDRIGFGRG